MKTLIIYTSQTGFTKKYAQWLADKVSGDLMDLKEAKKKRDVFLKAMMRSAMAVGLWPRR